MRDGGREGRKKKGRQEKLGRDGGRDEESGREGGREGRERREGGRKGEGGREGCTTLAQRLDCYVVMLYRGMNAARTGVHTQQVKKMSCALQKVYIVKYS